MTQDGDFVTWPVDLGLETNKPTKRPRLDTDRLEEQENARNGNGPSGAVGDEGERIEDSKVKSSCEEIDSQLGSEITFHVIEEGDSESEFGEVGLAQHDIGQPGETGMQLLSTETQETVQEQGGENDTDDEISYTSITPPPLPSHELVADVEKVSMDALYERIALLEQENKNLKSENNAIKTKAATLSPSVYQVHAPKEVRRMRLGRTASISTRDELIRLAQNPGSMTQKPPFEEQPDFIMRMNNLIRPDFLSKEDAYLHSKLFVSHMVDLCNQVMPLLRKESRVLAVSSPLYVFGDFHGNMEDLRFFAEHIWPMGMNLCAGKFIFLGDYVDRGAHGLELVAYLLAQKIQFPDKIFLIRGNHETRTVNGWEFFYQEGSFLYQCKERFGPAIGYQLWEKCNQVFDCMPLAAIVDESIFCVHGGIPCPTPTTDGQDTRLECIKKIRCPIDIQPPSPDVNDLDNELAFSLLWADPADSTQETCLQESESGFAASARGGGTVVFGNKAVHDFLDQHKLNYIMRAHEATASGVSVCKSAKVLTVFSTSKDHGCGGDAKCGCFLVDRRKIQAITRSAEYPSTTSYPIDEKDTLEINSNR